MVIAERNLIGNCSILNWKGKSNGINGIRGISIVSPIPSLPLRIAAKIRF